MEITKEQMMDDIDNIIAVIDGMIASNPKITIII